MLEATLKLLKKIESHGFQVYAVGGFVRDYYMGKKSLDVDICTNATPYDLNHIFKGALMPIEKYGSVTVIFKKVRFEITTYRREIRYKNRKPVEIEYIDDLLMDLKRRDFTINTLCLNSKGQIIDLLNGIRDIEDKIITTIGNPDLKLKEDPLRILRAIRFATILDFQLDRKLKTSVVRNRKLLKNLSYTRKKEELTRIFASPNAEYGIKLLSELKLDEYLDLPNLKTIKVVDDILGIWAQLDVLDIYPFSKTERDTIIKIKNVLSEGKIDEYIIYQYSLYVTSIAASIMDIDKKEIVSIYNNLAIKSRNDIKLDVLSLCSLLNKKPGKWIKNIYEDLEKKIIYNELSNDPKILIDYVYKNK